MEYNNGNPLGTSIQGDEIVIASEAEGDILYFNGTAWVRLPKGTALQYLRQNAGLTAPEYADFPTIPTVQLKEITLSTDGTEYSNVFGGGGTVTLKSYTLTLAASDIIVGVKTRFNSKVSTGANNGVQLKISSVNGSPNGYWYSSTYKGTFADTYAGQCVYGYASINFSGQADYQSGDPKIWVLGTPMFNQGILIGATDYDVDLKFTTDRACTVYAKDIDITVYILTNLTGQSITT